MQIIWFPADTIREWNTSAHRIMTPAKQLARAGHTCYVAHVAELTSGNTPENTKKAIEKSDVIVIERLPIKEAHPFIIEQKNLGKKVWITFDDNYALMPGGNSHQTWRGGKDAFAGRGSLLGDFRAGLRLATGFMTPSRLLCDDYSMYNANAAHVPNYLDLDIWEGLPKPDPHIITIGYGGSSLHNISLKESGVLPAIGKLCKSYPKLQFHLQPVFDDVVMQMKRLGVRYSLGDWQNFRQWPATVSQFRIGIAPLSGKYDMRRSNLKVLEYATVGVPWVATDDAPYVDARGGILISNKTSEWYDALRELINNPSFYQELSVAGRAWAQDHNSQCVKRYEEIFNV